MCGIVGIFSRSSTISAEVLQRATQSLYHRGPDGQRQWISTDRRVGLGHSRLSIIDLTTGDQPIASEDGRTRIVVNGEFYGYEAIQRELEASGHRLRSGQTAKLFFTSMKTWDPMPAPLARRVRFCALGRNSPDDFCCPRPLRHQAVVLCIPQRHPLLRVRGEGAVCRGRARPVGSRDRFITRSSSAGIRCGRYMTEFIRFRLDTTCLRPTSTFRCTGTGILTTPRQTETLRTARTQNTPTSSGTALEESVRVRLRADVPVGCYFSGGLDSCAVLGLAAKHHPGADSRLYLDLRSGRI